MSLLGSFVSLTDCGSSSSSHLVFYYPHSTLKIFLLKIPSASFECLRRFSEVYRHPRHIFEKYISYNRCSSVWVINKLSSLSVPYYSWDFLTSRASLSLLTSLSKDAALFTLSCWSRARSAAALAVSRLDSSSSTCLSNLCFSLCSDSASSDRIYKTTLISRNTQDLSLNWSLR